MSLAERFHGEIINGDALQMYEGLPITTNKVSVEQQRGIPHHLLGCIKLGEDPWIVHHFLARARSIIEDIRSRGKLPVLVGGSHHYLQSLLFPQSLVEDYDGGSREKEEDKEREWPILSAKSKTMWDELKKVDPVMAQRWHPQDGRKIRRSLQIWLQTGRKPSEVYEEQQSSLTATESGVFKHSDVTDGDDGQDPLIFWTHCSSPVLQQRIDDRVGRMVSNGLLDEVQSMHCYQKAQAQQGKQVDDSRGIWIAIGYKEMLPYIANPHSTDAEKDECIDRTKIATRQYARRQKRWIRSKLLLAAKQIRLDGKVFLLDATDVEHYSTNVETAAQSITSSFLAGDVLPEPRTLSDAAKEMLLPEAKVEKNARYCEACDKTLMTEPEWLRHLKTLRHSRATKPKVDWSALYPNGERTYKNLPRMKSRRDEFDNDRT